MSGDSNQAKSIFLEAIGHAPAEWSAFLDQACGGDLILRAEVERLLQAQVELGTFHESQRPSLGAACDPSIREAPGTHIGPYKLLEQIGEGGFGVVFMAEQQQPVRRKVALKVLKPGMDTRQVVARFEAERQALAIMDHPNIAKVYDGGATLSGRPYFVMELVKGVPITEFSDQNRLQPRQRLQLFISVCHAVQHAHQKGIVHRDLKPSNVLVTVHDTTPVVKVIDFGVAKALGQELTTRTLFTGFAQLIGTPLYMSPEQAGQSGLDIDTRSDIYSLGVLLYELLTGTTPFGKERFRKAAYDEICQIIRDEEPPKPSTRLSDLGKSGSATRSIRALNSTDTSEPTWNLASVSALRLTEPAKLTKLLRGELDWIVMKALEKDRNRRFETADALAIDIQHYLADEPVEALPPTAAYRLKKFLQRNRRSVLAAAVFLLLLVSGFVGTTIGLMESRRQRDAAEAVRANETREKNRAIAAEVLASKRLTQIEAAQRRMEDERAVALAINEFLKKDLLGQADISNQPFGSDLPERNPKITVRELLDRAEQTVAGKFTNQPLVEAALRQTLADTYGALGEFALAIPHGERALALRRSHLGSDHSDALTSLNNLAVLYRCVGKKSEAIALLEQVRDARIKKVGLEHPETLATLQYLAAAYLSARRVNEAIAFLEQVRDARIKKSGPDHPDTLYTLSALASAYLAAGKRTEAIGLLKQIQEPIRKAYGPDHRLTLGTLTSLGGAYLLSGNTTEAIDILQQVRVLQVEKHGPDDPGSLILLANLAAAYQSAGKPEQALILLREAAVSVENRSFLHENAADIIGNLCSCHERLNQFADAEIWRRKWLVTVKQTAGPESGPYAGALMQLGANLLKQAKFAEAEPVLRECRELIRNIQPEAWTTFEADSLLGGALVGLGKYSEAESLLLNGYQGMKQRETKISPHNRFRLTDALERLVQLYEAWAMKVQADEWRKKWQQSRSENEMNSNQGET